MKKKIISVLLLLSVLNGTCYAGCEISQKNSSEECNISGQFDVANMSVALEILKKGVTEEELKNIDYSKESIGDFGLQSAFTLTTDENGQINRDIIMNAPSGIYTYRYRAADGNSGTGSFRYSDEEDTANFVKNVNSAKKVDELYSLINRDGENIQLDMECYKALNENGKKYALEYILNKDFKDFEALSEEFGRGVLEAVLKYKPSGETVMTAVDKYEALTDAVNAKYYKEYKNMSTAQRKMMGDIIVKNAQISSINTFNSRFDEVVATAYVSDAEWTELETYIRDYSGILGISLQSYNNIRNKSDVLKKLENKNYYSVSEFASAFNKAVSSALSGNSGGSGSSGSSGGGGGGSIVVVNDTNSDPIVKTPEPQNEGQSKAFSDMDSVPWAEEAITSLYKAGIVNGKTKNEFYPNDNITREEFLKLIIEGLKLTDDTAKCDFKDVLQDSWYYKYIASGVSKGIVNGISQTSFGVGKNISRQDMAVMTVRALEYINVELKENVKPVEFTDNISDYAVNAVKVLQTAGIINGVSDTSFAPLSSATRAQAAKVIYGVLKSMRIL